MPPVGSCLDSGTLILRTPVVCNPTEGWSTSAAMEIDPQQGVRSTRELSLSASLKQT